MNIEDAGSTVVAADSGDEEEHPVSWRRMVIETLQLIVLAFVIAFLIKTLLVQAFYIPSASMENTLLVGDRVLVEKVTYRFGEIERGDVVVFRRPGQETNDWAPSEMIRSFGEGIGLISPDENRDLIKRVIGIEGDVVEIDAGVVLVNGAELTEPYVIEDARSFGPYIVPDGEIFVMGDNRPNSLDSRFALGTVPAENVVGKAFAIIWPADSFLVGISAEHPNVPSSSPAIPDNAGRPEDNAGTSGEDTVPPRADVDTSLQDSDSPRENTDTATGQ